MNIHEIKKLFLPYYSQLYQEAYGLLGSTADAEALIQDVFLKIWEKQLDANCIVNPESYALLLVQNMCIERIRFLCSLPESSKSDDDTIHSKEAPSSKPTEQHDLKEQLYLLIQQLPHPLRLVMWLRDVNGYTMDRIQEITGLTAIHIQVSLSRARKRIRKQFNGLISYEQL